MLHKTGGSCVVGKPLKCTVKQLDLIWLCALNSPPQFSGTAREDCFQLHCPHQFPEVSWVGTSPCGSRAWKDHNYSSKHQYVYMLEPAEYQTLYDKLGPCRNNTNCSTCSFWGSKHNKWHFLITQFQDKMQTFKESPLFQASNVTKTIKEMKHFILLWVELEPTS